MLNVWIDYPNNDPDSDDDLSTTADFQGGVQTNVRSWEERFDYPEESPQTAGQELDLSFTAEDFDTHSISRSFSPIPVVSTEAGSTYSSADQDNSQHIPSARVYYCPNQVKNPEQIGIGSNNRNAHAPAARIRENMPRPSHQPQIHVQVNLPSNPRELQNSTEHHSYGSQEESHRIGGVRMATARKPAVNNLPPGNATLANHQGGRVHSMNQNGNGQGNVPMLFENGGNNNGMGYGGSNNGPGQSQTNGSGDNNNGSSGGHRNQFYSSFVPESDFLEFHSMYYHLCEFYSTYGHANVPKHPNHFILASWVDELRQRKHIFDLQERGVDVANTDSTAEPLSRRQTQLLEDLGFRWHITTSENASIIEHMKLVDESSNSTAFEDGQGVDPRDSLVQVQEVQGNQTTSDASSSSIQQIQQAQAQQAAIQVQALQAQQQQQAWGNITNGETFQVIGGYPLQGVGGSIQASSHPLIQNITGYGVSNGRGLNAVPINGARVGGLQNVASRAPAPAFTPSNLSVLQQQHGQTQTLQQFQDRNLYAGHGIGVSHGRAVHEEEDDDDDEDEDDEDLQVQEPRDPNLDSAEYAWKMQFKKLAEYKRKNGHCSVPARYNEDPKLGHWVMTQRRQFNLMKRGKGSSMTADRIKALNDLGFSWSIRIDPEKMWNLRFQQLKEYKKTYGDCLVPQRFADNPKLGTWVNTQRRHYKLMKEGKPSCMNEERVKILEDEGFAWSTSTNAPGSAIKRLNNAMRHIPESQNNSNLAAAKAANAAVNAAAVAAANARLRKNGANGNQPFIKPPARPVLKANIRPGPSQPLINTSQPSRPYQNGINNSIKTKGGENKSGAANGQHRTGLVQDNKAQGPNMLTSLSEAATLIASMQEKGKKT